MSKIFHNWSEKVGSYECHDVNKDVQLHIPFDIEESQIGEKLKFGIDPALLSTDGIDFGDRAIDYGLSFQYRLEDTEMDARIMTNDNILEITTARVGLTLGLHDADSDDFNNVVVVNCKFKMPGRYCLNALFAYDYIDEHGDMRRLVFMSQTLTVAICDGEVDPNTLHVDVPQQQRKYDAYLRGLPYYINRFEKRKDCFHVTFVNSKRGRRYIVEEAEYDDTPVLCVRHEDGFWTIEDMLMEGLPDRDVPCVAEHVSELD